MSDHEVDLLPPLDPDDDDLLRTALRGYAGVSGRQEFRPATEIRRLGVRRHQRRVVGTAVGTLLASAAAGLLVVNSGLLSSQSTGLHHPPPATGVNETGTLPPTTPVSTPTPTSGADGTTQSLAGRSLPDGYLTTPAAANLDFGYLVGMTRSPNGTYSLTVDLAEFLSGDAARAYASGHGMTLPSDGHLVVNASPARRHFQLTPGAVLFGDGLLTSGSQGESAPEPLTSRQLFQRFLSLPPVTASLPEVTAGSTTVSGQGQGSTPSTRRQVMVWLRHDGTADGPVNYLAEQWTAP